MRGPTHLTVLGGGPAGLAVGHFAKRAGLSFHIFEAQDQVGGNARTLEQDRFLFDTGAHRFHDRIPEITREVQELLGAELARVDIPSRIYYQGRLLAFPISPVDLCWKLGPWQIARGVADLVAARCKGRPPEDRSDFESHALYRYGRTIAEAFLLGYSQKLWGLPCSQLSLDVGGRRTQGLNLKTFLLEWFLGSKGRVEHLDGRFYYPRSGIGAIVEALAGSCGAGSIQTNSRITRLSHDHSRIRLIQCNGREETEPDEVVSSLPLPLLVRLLDPSAPPEILEAAGRLRFRNLILVMLALKRDSVFPYGSIYVPDPKIPFTRVYEPKNRSSQMAPSGRTSLVAEIPCSPGDETWVEKDSVLESRTLGSMVEMGWLDRHDRIDGTVTRICHAYPILDLASRDLMQTLALYLDRFANLTLTGRNGRFVYAHLHDMLDSGKRVVDRFLRGATESGAQGREVSVLGGAGL